MKLTESQIKRQDLVDNSIFQILQVLNPADKHIEWNIELIGDVRDAVENVIVTELGLCKSSDFYPFVEE